MSCLHLKTTTILQTRKSKRFVQDDGVARYFANTLLTAAVVKPDFMLSCGFVLITKTSANGSDISKKEKRSSCEVAVQIQKSDNKASKMGLNP